MSTPNPLNPPRLTSVFCPGDVFWRGDHQWKAPVPDAQVGRWRGCGQKTLGEFFHQHQLGLFYVHHHQHQLSLFLFIVIIITIRLVWSSSQPLLISEHYPKRTCFNLRLCFTCLTKHFKSIPSLGLNSTDVYLLIYLQSKFLAFYQYAKTFNSDTFDYEELNRTDYVFMRWKEHFLVPDHTIKVWTHLRIKWHRTKTATLQDINGASFAGFYYICFQKSSSTVEGYYFHRNSEWWVIIRAEQSDSF